MASGEQLERLPQQLLQERSGPVSSAFLAAGASNVVEAFELVWSLPYGRNARPDAQLAPLTEARGTCSTKHALLAQLCEEQHVSVELRIGIYEMSEANTPGVGPVLDRHGLAFVPEAHCFLVFEGQRIDVTRRIDAGSEPIDTFLYEERIQPAQVGDYKRAAHRGFIGQWATESPHANGLSPESLWAIREECILALSH